MYDYLKKIEQLSLISSLTNSVPLPGAKFHNYSNFWGSSGALVRLDLIVVEDTLIRGVASQYSILTEYEEDL